MEERSTHSAITAERFTQLLSSGSGLQTHTLLSVPFLKRDELAVFSN
jgi:hypothetical protein